MTLNQGYRYRRVLGPEASGLSVHAYLVEFFDHSTATEWKQRLDAGQVLLDEKTAQALHPLRAGQVLTWNRPPWIEPNAPVAYQVIHEDESLVAIHKPSGLPTIPGGGFYLNTLVNRVRREFPSALPLHRLGRGTSGLVLFAKNSRVASLLHQQWPRVEKQYQALATGMALLDRYDIDFPIGPCPHERLGQVHGATPEGKPARSLARVLEKRPASTVFEVDLLTGRPHQIRIHLACIGHPLVGDPLYASGGHPEPESPGLPGDTGYHLHARTLRFVHPRSGKRLELTAPLPEVLRVTGNGLNQKVDH